MLYLNKTKAGVEENRETHASKIMHSYKQKEKKGPFPIVEQSYH